MEMVFFAKMDEYHAIECWDTDQWPDFDDEEADEYEYAWYFNEYVRAESGLWYEHDGGIFCGYDDARALCEDLGYTTPISEDEMEKIRMDEQFIWECSALISRIWNGDGGTDFATCHKTLRKKGGIEDTFNFLQFLKNKECKELVKKYNSTYFNF